MITTPIIEQILTGGLLGFLGQGIRMTIGLKKVADSQRNPNVESQSQDSNRMVVSLLIGFIAGALFVLLNEMDISDRKNILTVIVVGYSGTDFIEGLFSTYLQKITPLAPPSVTPTTPNASSSSLHNPTVTPIVAQDRDDDDDVNH